MWSTLYICRSGVYRLVFSRLITSFRPISSSKTLIVEVDRPVCLQWRDWHILAPHRTNMLFYPIPAIRFSTITPSSRPSRRQTIGSRNIFDLELVVLGLRNLYICKSEKPTAPDFQCCLPSIKLWHYTWVYTIESYMLKNTWDALLVLTRDVGYEIMFWPVNCVLCSISTPLCSYVSS